jgi:hypothetical protein
MVLSKIKFSLIPLFIFLFLSNFSFGQSGSVYQDWTKLPDSPTHLEVSWKTTKCSPLEADQIRLFVFNESGNARTADFTLTISDQGQSNVTHTVAGFALTAGQSVTANCGSGIIPELTIDIPNGFDPNTLTISITYN